MEDEKWQDNFAPEESERSREGYKPSDNENGDQSVNRPMRAGRVMRPRIQRAERAYSANGADGAQECGGVRGACDDFLVVGLEQCASLRAPVLL